jgi:hypothetical protein
MAWLIAHPRFGAGEALAGLDYVFDAYEIAIANGEEHRRGDRRQLLVREPLPTGRWQPFPRSAANSRDRERLACGGDSAVGVVVDVKLEADRADLG